MPAVARPRLSALIARTTVAVTLASLWLTPARGDARGAAPSRGAAAPAAACSGDDADALARARGQLARDARVAADACLEQLESLVEREDAACHVEALWTAAECATATGDVERAAAQLERIVAAVPSTPRGADAMLQLAELYRATARFPEALVHVDAFIAQHAQGDRRGPDTLETAFVLRRDLGDRAGAIAAIDAFQRLYRRSRPRQAARLEWARGALLDDDRARLEHARRFLKTHAQGDGLEALAHARVGELLWRRSCPGRTLEQGCFTFPATAVSANENLAAPQLERARAELQRRQQWSDASRRVERRLVETDGAASRPRVRLETRLALAREKHHSYRAPRTCSGVEVRVDVKRRDDKLAQAAITNLRRVITLHERRGDKLAAELDPSTRAAYLDAVAMANLILVDAELDAYLAIETPQNLDFSVEEYKRDSGLPKWEQEYERQVERRQQSIKRFQRFMDDKLGDGAKLVARYDEVVKLARPTWSALATARAGVVSESFARGLEGVALPRAFNSAVLTEAFCGALGKRAVPLRRTAADRMRQCAALAGELGASPAVITECEAGAIRLEPTRVVRQRELYLPGTLAERDAQPQSVGVLTQLDDAPR